jgi:hypothetical protein
MLRPNLQTADFSAEDARLQWVGGSMLSDREM